MTTKYQVVDIRFPIAWVGTFESILNKINFRYSQLERVLPFKNHYKAILRECNGLCLVLFLFWEEIKSPLKLPLKGKYRDPLIGDVEADDFLNSVRLLILNFRGRL